LENGNFRWPRFGEGVMKLTGAQAAALIEGLDWARVHAQPVARPVMAQ
jgi:transposase